MTESIHTDTLSRVPDPADEHIRVHVGPGYRVYFAQIGRVVLLLLCGGDKSTQKRDIERAKRLLRDSKED